MNTKYTISKISKSFYDSIRVKSIHSNGFNDLNFMLDYNDKISFLLVKFTDHPILVYPCVEDKVCDMNFIQYNGLIYTDYYNGLTVNKQLLHKIEAISLISSVFFSNSHILRLDTNDLDIRPFLFLNKFTNENYVNVIPKYTAVISLKNKSNSEILNSFRSDRKKQFRKNASQIFTLSGHISENDFRNLYFDTVNVPDVDLMRINNSLRKLFRLLNRNKNFRVLVISLPDVGVIGYQLLLIDKSYANAVIFATKKEYKNFSVTLRYNAIIFSKELGVEHYDFNGANSLIGSEEKASYGAIEKLYFEIAFKGVNNDETNE